MSHVYDLSSLTTFLQLMVLFFPGSFVCFFETKKMENKVVFTIHSFICIIQLKTLLPEKFATKTLFLKAKKGFKKNGLMLYFKMAFNIECFGRSRSG